jgi:hypothetical protein
MIIDRESFASPYEEAYIAKFICHQERRIYICETETEKVIKR